MGLDTARSQPAREPEAIPAGLEGDGNAVDLMPRFSASARHRSSDFNRSFSSAVSFLRGRRSTPGMIPAMSQLFDSSPKQRHNAGYHTATIHYRFHPLAGMVLPVRARRVYRDTALLIVRHPDGSLSHVPEWMTSPEAAVFSPRSLVVLPVRNLRDLRNTLDALLSSFSSDSDDGGGRGNTTCRQSTKSVSTGDSAGSARASEALAIAAQPVVGGRVRRKHGKSYQGERS
jgi:hypothetical protein